MKKAQYFITCGELATRSVIGEMHPDLVRKVLVHKKTARKGFDPDQTTIVFPEP